MALGKLGGTWQGGIGGGVSRCPKRRVRVPQGGGRGAGGGIRMQGRGSWCPKGGVRVWWGRSGCPKVGVRVPGGKR